MIRDCKGAATIRETSGDPGRNFSDLSSNGNAHCTIWQSVRQD
jgi:hypothetical protein